MVFGNKRDDNSSSPKKRLKLFHNNFVSRDVLIYTWIPIVILSDQYWVHHCTTLRQVPDGAPRLVAVGETPTTTTAAPDTTAAPPGQGTTTTESMDTTTVSSASTTAQNALLFCFSLFLFLQDS